MSLQPHEYPRRILLAVAGLNPQVVTETLYAMAVRKVPSFVPTEIHLLTTAEGRQRAELALISDEPGWFHRLREDYGLPPIAFDAEHIHVISAPDGQMLEDIRSPADNECLADQITERVRKLTADDDCAVHVSIAGGRKTMGFYLGYALSLFGLSLGQPVPCIGEPTLRVELGFLLSNALFAGHHHSRGQTRRYAGRQGGPGRYSFRASAQ